MDAATSDAGSGLGSSDGGAEISAAGLRAQDITILYPYPTAAELPSLLTASSTGERGVLIPQEAFELFPALVSHPRDRENSRDELRVVGVRANCAFDTSAREDPCHGQLQLVFQVLAPAADGTNAEVFDASVHGVYPLDDTTFLSLVRDLRDLRRAMGDHEPEPLSVHPILERDGLDGDYADGLAAIVLRYAGAETLHKATFITIDEPTPDARGGEIWTFGAVVEHDGVWASLEIPAFETATTSQRLTSVGSALTLAESSFDVLVAPALPATTDLSGLFGAGAVTDAEGATDAYEIALELENPLIRSADDSDCITCHITHARARGEILAGLTPEDEPAYYGAGAAVGTSTVRSAVGVRAMGWSVFAPRPADATTDERASRALSQRVINETAYTLALLETMLDG